VVAIEQRHPEEIISSGTPKDIDPMKPGNVVEVHIEGIGTLRNTVEAFR
jgi:2-keto-4-pentenoate hydratase/2-oxohepta-3-ene-1,7-dioic acid hydratase in catechol pathway